MTALQDAVADLTGGYTDGYVDAGDLRLHHTDWNPDGGRPVVMVHGANVQLHTWDPIAASLAATRRVICLDLRGHGDSSWARDGYQVAKFVDDIHTVTTALNLAPFDYVGHSLGARVGLAYAGAHPETVRRLVLSDTGPEMPREGAKFAQSIVGSTGDIRGFRNHDEALAHFQKLHPEWQPIFHELHVQHQLRENWAGKLVFKSDPDLFWMTGSAGVRDIPYVWEMTARITAPTLMLWGQRSGFLDDELIGRLGEAIASFEVARTDTGHYIPREAPEEFTKLVQEFLDR
ncbi:MAG TPA: alpha/beta hydrolase [Candidatus Dormibacteraeota bacterium]|jgi:pimeloyl-ACP methyl ester carboxylesterase|nr:alpha/beta hydrolase [Candidatus Dormibacteraeota bacterium]